MPVFSWRYSQDEQTRKVSNVQSSNQESNPEMLHPLSHLNDSDAKYSSFNRSALREKYVTQTPSDEEQQEDVLIILICQCEWL